MGIHLDSELSDQSASVTVENTDSSLDPVRIAILIDARPGTQSDMHRQTTLRKQFFAVANPEMTA
jgi:hypothetical protein